jgi:hypothetical protein
MAQMKLTLNGLFQFDNSLFDNLELPSELEKDTCIQVILEKCGEFPLLYPDFDYMKYAIGVFSKKWEWTLNKWATAINIEYDPLYNFDRHEIYTDTSKTKAESNTNATSLNEVSAFNDIDSATPNMKPTSKATSEAGGTNKGEGTNTHEGRLYGNIGVTTSQQMLQSELNLGYWNIYNEIANLFSTEYCIRIY